MQQRRTYNYSMLYVKNVLKFAVTIIAQCALPRPPRQNFTQVNQSDQKDLL